MSQPFPNVIPAQGSHILDAFTLDHGPPEVIVPLVLRLNMIMRALGITVRVRHDFDALVAHNERELAKGETGNWFKLVTMLDPDYGASAENAVWICGENKDGDIVFTVGGRTYYWPETTLHDEVRLMFYGGREIGQHCTITAEITRSITGLVNCGAAFWIRPDYRKLRLTPLISRMCRAYQMSRWPLDYIFILTQPDVHQRVIDAYGFPRTDHSIFFPGSPWGELRVAVASITQQEAYDDLALFLRTVLSVDEAPASLSTSRLDSVRKISSDSVLQGSMSLS